MATNRIALSAARPTRRASVRGMARLIAGFVIFSQGLVLISDASPRGGEIGANDFQSRDRLQLGEQRVPRGLAGR